MTPKIGQIEEGYSFIGGDPADKNSWKKIGEVEDGYSFKGGDPADKNSWTPVEDIQQPEQKGLGTKVLETGEDYLKSVGKGASFGFADELSGALGATIDPLLYGDEGKSWKQRYQENRDFARRDAEMSRERSPIASTIGELQGAMTGGGAVGRGVVKAGSKMLPSAVSNIASKAPAALKGAAGVATEGAAYGLGESKADLTEGEFAEALKDTGIASGISLGTSGAIKGATKLVRGGATKLFGQGGKNLATDAAGDILELTPKIRTDAAKDMVKLGPGVRTNVAEELPKFLKEQGGIVQKATTIKKNSEKVLRESGEQIEKVLNDYDYFFKKIPGALDEIGAKMDDAFIKGTKPPVEAVQGAKSIFTKYNFQKEMAFKFSDLANTLEKKVEDLRNMPGFEGQLAKLDKHIEKLRKFKGSGGENNAIESIKELHNFRKSTDKLIKSFAGPKATSNDALLQEALIDTRRQLSNHLQDNMLGKVKDFAKKSFEEGLIDEKTLNKLTEMQDKIYKANRNYKLASFVDDNIEQAISRKDARKLISTTDVILGGTLGASSAGTGLAAVGAKKAGEFIRPRAQLYSPEIGNFIEKTAPSIRRGITQQSSQEESIKNSIENYLDNPNMKK